MVDFYNKRKIYDGYARTHLNTRTTTQCPHILEDDIRNNDEEFISVYFTMIIKRAYSWRDHRTFCVVSTQN